MASSHSHPDFDDELLSAYVDNELTADERATVESLLRTDERARQMVADLRAASEAVKSLPRVPLGRDLRSSVLAEIDRLHPAMQAPGETAAEPPAILTMPTRNEERRPRGFRPLIWAAFAAAAALLLMVALPAQKQQLQDKQTVAMSSGEKKFESATPDRESNTLSGSARRKGDADDSEIDKGIVHSEAVPKSTAAGDARYGRSGLESLGERPAAPLEQAVSEPFAAAPPATAVPPAAAMDEATSVPTPVRTYEVTVSGDGSLAALEELLREQNIEVTNDQLPADLIAALPAIEFQRFAETREGAADSASDAGAAAKPAPAEALLVEASPEQIAALIAALQVDPAAFPEVLAKDLSVDQRALEGAATTAAAPAGAADATASAARGGGFAGGGGGGGAGGRGDARQRGAYFAEEATASRAWRLSPLRGIADTPQPAAAPAAAKSVDAAPASVAAQEPASGSELRDSARLPGAERVRVLFILRRNAK